MATIQIPSANSAFRPYNKSPTIGTMVTKMKKLTEGEDKGVLQKCEMIKVEGGSSGVDFQDGFKMPSWEGLCKKIRVEEVRRPNEEEDRKVCVVESKKRDYLSRLKIEDKENRNETIEKTRHSENEMKKKQVIENTNNDGNIPTTKASSSTKTFLFEKKLFPSDVSGLNRLLIPRKLAEKFLPPLKIDKETYKKETLVFLDHQSIAWEMKFEFWPSSQSYVLTKGWRAFVNKYQLKANFMIRFYQLDQFLDKNHYGIEYVVQEPIPTDIKVPILTAIKLFGQDFQYLCPDANNGGQNKIVGQGEAKEEAMK